MDTGGFEHLKKLLSYSFAYNDKYFLSTLNARIPLQFMKCAVIKIVYDQDLLKECRKNTIHDVLRYNCETISGLNCFPRKWKSNFFVESSKLFWWFRQSVGHTKMVFRVQSIITSCSVGLKFKSCPLVYQPVAIWRINFNNIVIIIVLEIMCFVRFQMYGTSLFRISNFLHPNTIRLFKF